MKRPSAPSIDRARPILRALDSRTSVPLFEAAGTFPAANLLTVGRWASP